MYDVPIGSVWRLKSGHLVQVERANVRGKRMDCFYVDEFGQRIAASGFNSVCLTREFLEIYGRRVTLEAPVERPWQESPH